MIIKCIAMARQTMIIKCIAMDEIDYNLLSVLPTHFTKYMDETDYDYQMYGKRQCLYPAKKRDKQTSDGWLE